MKGNNTVFFLLFFSLSTLVGKVSAHPFFLSVSELRVDTKKQEINLSCRLFADDLENALTKIHHKPLDLIAGLKEASIQQGVDTYVRERFSLGMAGQKISFRFLGMEQEDEAIWCYFEANTFVAGKKMVISNSLLYDFLPEQVNVLHVYLDGERQSKRLVNPDKVVSFTF